MNRTKIKYAALNAKAQEDYLTAKLSAQLVNYGYVPMRLNNDYRGADLIALREGEAPMLIQQKGRCAVGAKYVGKGLYLAFPVNGEFYILLHDDLLEICRERHYLKTKAWTEAGYWHVPTPPKDMLEALAPYKL